VPSPGSLHLVCWLILSWPFENATHKEDKKNANWETEHAKEKPISRSQSFVSKERGPEAEIEGVPAHLSAIGSHAFPPPSDHTNCPVEVTQEEAFRRNGKNRYQDVHLRSVSQRLTQPPRGENERMKPKRDRAVGCSELVRKELDKIRSPIRRGGMPV